MSGEASPTLGRQKGLHLLCGAGLVLALLAVYARTLAPGVTWANDAADSGDLAAAAAIGGVPHPTGYPTYLAIARVFVLAAPAEPARALAWLSALAMALASLGVSLLVVELAASRSRFTPVAGALAGLAFGLAQLPWSQAVVAEVYALNALFAALLLLATLRRLRRHVLTPLAAVLEGTVAGLALGNHLTIAPLVLAWIGALVLAGRGRPPLAPRVVLALVGLLLGLLVYLVLPLAARARPPVNWGDPTGADGLWWLVSGVAYRDLAFAAPAETLSERVAAWTVLLVRQFGWPGVLLGFAGLLYGAPRDRVFVLATAALAVAWSLFALGYDTADSRAYLIPVYLVFVVWLGLALGRGLELLRPRGALALPALMAVGAALLLPAAQTASAVDASDDRRAIEFARVALAQAPPEAVVVTFEDRDTFALWYDHFALRRRPDLAVVAEPLLVHEWYRRTLRATYPWLAVADSAPSGGSFGLARADGASLTVCRAVLEAPTGLACDG